MEFYANMCFALSSALDFGVAHNATGNCRYAVCDRLFAPVLN